MEINLTRKTKTEKSAIGELTVNEFKCFILEDHDRGLIQSMPLEEIKEKKVYGQTAIPAGKYEVAVTFSNKFQKFLPLILSVPGFEGIRIHPGNRATDSEGCLLPGRMAGIDEVGESRKAFTELFTIIQKAVKKEKVFITIN